LGQPIGATFFIGATSKICFLFLMVYIILGQPNLTIGATDWGQNNNRWGWRRRGGGRKN
jgi:hypothetical protein